MPMPVSTTRCDRSPSTNPTLGTSGTPPSGITQTPAAISTGSLRTSGTGGLCISVIGRETNYAARVAEPEIAIVGAGIGGLAAAIALARKGVAAELFEQSPELATVGASLQLGPNAVRLLDELGLLPALRQVGVLTPAVELRRWDDDTVLLRSEL